MTILDAALIIEFSIIAAAVLQNIKTYPAVKGSMIPWISVFVAPLLVVVWFWVDDKFDNGIARNLYIALAIGITSAIGANSAYKLQKSIPNFPAILPSAAEIDEANLAEKIHKQELLVEAVKKGVPEDEAREVLGMKKKDPPPSMALQQVAPTPQESVVEKTTIDPNIEEATIG